MVFYTCIVCGHDDYAFKFAPYCPNCDTNLDMLEIYLNDEEDEDEI